MGLSHWVGIPSEEIGQLMQEYKLFMEIEETTNYLLYFARSYFFLDWNTSSEELIWLPNDVPRMTGSWVTNCHLDELKAN